MDLSTIADWHKVILALTVLMLLCAAIAIILRFAGKRKASRIFFIFFIAFLFAAFAVLLAYANERVREKEAGKAFQKYPLQQLTSNSERHKV